MAATKSKNGVSVKAAPLSSYDANRLYRMRFQDTAFIIAKMDTMQKANVAAQIQPVLDSLYATANKWGNEEVEPEDQPTAAQYMGIMGKIKHWETILYWLYEIDIMLENADLKTLALQAELDLEHYKLGIKGMTESARDKAQATIQKAQDRVAHTSEILDLTLNLTRKYNV
jgi:hypothetical protein